MIKYDETKKCLFTSLFWPYMPMRCAAQGVFELISFPVELRFRAGARGLQFEVRGNYDWDLNGQVFTRV